MMINDAASAQKFADALIEAPRSFADRTSISAGIDFAMVQLERAPYAGQAPYHRRVRRRHQQFRPRRLASPATMPIAKGITINGLVILSERPIPWNPEHTNPPGGLANYYRNNVIGGPGAFVMVAENFASFGQAIIKKLIAEIAQLPPPAAALPAAN